MSHALDDFLRAALAEDLGEAGDVTSSATIPETARARAHVVARAPGCVAGLDVALRVFTLVDPDVRIERSEGTERSAISITDGTVVPGGARLATVEGRARSLLAAERLALNLLGHLSGIATATRSLVDRVQGTRATIVDTRKTTPGMRALEKAAVRAGGGGNHRMGLYDAVLIKDNHVRAVGSVEAAVRKARRALDEASAESAGGTGGSKRAVDGNASAAGGTGAPNAALGAIARAAQRQRTAGADGAVEAEPPEEGRRRGEAREGGSRRSEAREAEPRRSEAREGEPRRSEAREGEPRRSEAREGERPAGVRAPLFLEVEIDRLQDLEAAIAAGADVVLLDNMDPATMRAAVERASGRCLLEASGGITLETVRDVAETGVDFISVGWITHSAPALDVALDFED